MSEKKPYLRKQDGKDAVRGDVIHDFNKKPWFFLYVTNGPISYDKVVACEAMDRTFDAREFFVRVFTYTQVYRR